MTIKGGATPACAACKYQRRRCSDKCALAPYFPANQPKMFQNVHRLFGVSSITKTLKALKTKDQKDDALKSIIFEAEMREKFPVQGCTEIISQLKLQLLYTVEELRHVYSQLDVYRGQVNTQQEQPSNYLEFGNELSYNVNQNFMNDNMEKTFMGLDSLSNNLTAIQTQMDAFGIHDKEILHQNYEGASINPYHRDDRQSYIETKEVFQTSSGSSLKGTTQIMEHVSKSELRNAAADFTLTTLN